MSDAAEFPFFERDAEFVTQEIVADVFDLGFELASHGVSHSLSFSENDPASLLYFPLGTRDEQYQDYYPENVETTSVPGCPFCPSLYTLNGSVLAELRVSKFLLEYFAPPAVLESFRPGYLHHLSSLFGARERPPF